MGITVGLYGLESRGSGNRENEGTLERLQGIWFHGLACLRGSRGEITGILKTLKLLKPQTLNLYTLTLNAKPI